MDPVYIVVDSQMIGPGESERTKFIDVKMV